MCSSSHHALLCAKGSTGQHGLTLVELLVSMAILAVLAVVALPYAEMTVKRTQELELKQSLRTIRSAIDRFADDVATGRVSKLTEGVSDNGYPKTLQVLVNGVQANKANGDLIRYLRRLPADPLTKQRGDTETAWRLFGYQDQPDTLFWNGKDVYDVRSTATGQAIDGSLYGAW